MTIADWLMISAVLLGQIIAVQLTRYLDDKKEQRDRKLQVFKTLMATRAYNVSWDHVVALNRIDLEFDKDNKKEKAVIEACKAYLDLLGDKSMLPEQWTVKRVDLLVDLLHKMAQVLDYDFDKTHIKNSSYSPMVHGNIEEEQNALRAGLLEVLEGKSHSNGSSKLATGKMNANNAINADRAKACRARPIFLICESVGVIFCEFSSPIPRSHNIWGSQYRHYTRARDINTNLPLRTAVYTRIFSISYPGHFLRPVPESCIAASHSIVNATRDLNPAINDHCPDNRQR